MSATQKFFRFLFGQAGDRAVVPDATQVDGTVSYQEGFGFDYQRPKTDAAAKNIPRDSSNQIYYDLSLGIRQYQLHGFPEWVPAADNGGAAVEYDAQAIVLYTDGNLYQSIVAANTGEPTVDPTKWKLFTPNRGTQVFTGSGNFIVPPGVYDIWVSGCAAGGGGGGSAGTNGTSTGTAGGGGGGGAGGCSMKQHFSVTPGQTLTVSIGSAGSAGSGGAQFANGGNGGPGGNTVLAVSGGATLLTLTGGGGGSQGIYNAGNGGGGFGGAGGGGGNLGTGSRASAGDDGGVGGGGGAGGPGPFGTAGGHQRGSISAAFTGNATSGFGVGGGGGGATYTNSGATGAPGAVGAPGFLLIEY